MVVCLSVLLAACAATDDATEELADEPPPDDGSAAEQPEEDEEPAAAAEYNVAIGGGPGGGSSFNISAAMGEIVRSESDVLTPTVEEVSIVQTNLTRLEAGEIQLGFNTTFDVWQAENADGPFEDGAPVEGINFVMGGTLGGFGFVVPAETGITTLEGLCGNTAAIGSETAKAILSSLLIPSGIDPDECLDWDFGITYDQIVVGYQDGTYQTAGFVAIPQTSSLLQLVETIDVNFVSPEPDVMDQILEEFPFFPPQVVEAGTLDQQDEDWIVGGFVQGVWTHESVPDDLVYEWVATAFEHIDRCAGIESGCGDYSAERTAEWINEGLTIVPPHPGLVRYLEDQGFDVEFPG